LREFTMRQAAAKATAKAQIVEMKRNAQIKARAEIKKFIEIAEMEVKLAETKAKEVAIVDAGVKAAASAYAIELTKKIAFAKS